MRIKIFLISWLLGLAVVPVGANAGLDAEMADRYKQFRELFDSGDESAFYPFIADYEDFLLKNGKKEEYYKIKCNEGFFDLGRRHLIRAMKTARQLDEDVRADKAELFFYLPTGLMGDIFKECHNLQKAESYYKQALDEVGDRDPKFSMLKYMSLAEMNTLKSPEAAIEWADKSLALATKEDNVEYVSMSLAIKAYVLFLVGNGAEFNAVYDRYVSLRSMGKPGFSHRYDNVVDVAHYAFDNEFERAESLARTKTLNVDRSLVLFRVYAMSGDATKGFATIASRYVELDSIIGESQDGNLTELASEMELVRAKDEAETSKTYAHKLVIAIIVLTALYVFVYIMGRRRLMLKIWARNKALKEALKKAEESDHMKGAFIRNMSHEIRTPLNAINGFSQLLCTPGYELDDEERRDMQVRITESVDSITNIVNELLELSQGESDMERKEVRPLDICREVVQVMNLKNTKGLDVTFATSLPDDFVMTTNGANVRRILLQLMDNAMKFTKEGSVTLTCEKAGSKVVFAVEDTGIGIDEKERERVFENFVKLDQYTGGVGLGLPVCQRLAGLIGGEVVLDATYEKPGSRFVLTLPGA